MEGEKVDVRRNFKGTAQFHHAERSEAKRESIKTRDFHGAPWLPFESL